MTLQEKDDLRPQARAGFKLANNRTGLLSVAKITYLLNAYNPIP